MHDIKAIVAKYRTKGVLVDTNLLILYYIGSIDENLIESSKRTKSYLRGDFMILKTFLECFEKIITTPNILTEVNNLLANSITGRYKHEFYEIFKRSIEVLEENYSDSKKVVKTEGFATFGITDTGILLSGVDNYLLITDDFPLSNKFASQGGEVINFNHIRTLGWN